MNFEEARKMFKVVKEFHEESYFIEISAEKPMSGLLGWLGGKNIEQVDYLVSSQPYDAIYQWVLNSHRYTDIVSITHKSNEFYVVVR